MWIAEKHNKLRKVNTNYGRAYENQIRQFKFSLIGDSVDE
jgi:hypothetical protein